MSSPLLPALLNPPPPQGRSLAPCPNPPHPHSRRAPRCEQGLSYSAAALLARLTAEAGGEPWLSPGWPLRPSANSIVERELEALLAAHRHELTAWGDTYGGRGRFESAYGGGGDMPVMAEAVFAMPETMSEDSAAGAPPSGLRTPGNLAGADDADGADGADGGAVGGGGGDGALSVRSGLVATPLFLAALQIDESGLASVPWQVRRPRVLANSHSANPPPPPSPQRAFPASAPNHKPASTPCKPSAPWQLPDNLGVFELRAYAVSGARFGGAATAEQTVRRIVSTSAAAPRVARVGDRFHFGVVLTAAPDAPAAGLHLRVEISLAPPATPADSDAAAAWPLVLHVGATAGAAGVAAVGAAAEGAAAVAASDERLLTMAASETVEVSFEAEAAAVGEAVAVVRVWQVLDASGSDARRETASEWREIDALELRVPVMGSQPEVTLATVTLTPTLTLTLTLSPTPNSTPTR